ncbi:MAG: hypothetical protein RBU29_14310, partial [bacterium]|nr:hypothetical protein [bacterium]
MNWTSERWFDKLWIYAVLAAGILLFWWRIWTPSPADVMHFTDDILIKDYPTRLGLFRTLLSGHLPLWDPYQFGGWPGIANCEAGFFYPFNWLLLPFVQMPQAAFQVSQLLVLFHLFIAGVGAYRLGRIVGLSPTGAVMTAVVFTFCGFHCAHKKHTNMLFALVWLPWLMGLVEQWVRRDRIQPLLRMALLLAMVHLAGHPQASLYITLVLAARLLQAAWLKAAAGGPRRFRVLVKAGGGGLLLLAFSVALAAIQWAPTWELIRQSERSEANQYQRSSEFSMPPYELADLLLPEIVYPESQVEVFYWGIIPLVLAFVTLVTTRWDAFTGYLVALMGFSILLALGDFLFVFDLSYLLVPGMAWVRAPSRLIYFATLPSALLAGKAVHDWLANPRLLVQSPSVGLTRRAFQVGMGIACGIAALYYPMVDLASRRQIVSELMILFLFAGGALLLLSLARHQKISATGLGVLLIVLAWLDLGSQYRMQDLAPGPGGYAMDWEIRRLQQMPWVQRTKVFFDGGGNRELYHGAAQGFPELDGQSPLTPALSWEIRQDTALDAYKRPNRVLLDLFGVNAILTDMVDRVPPGFQRESSRLFVSEALPARARLFQEILPCDPETQQGILTMQTFPFGEVALVDSAPIEERASQSGLFPKPFFLASVSGNGLQAGACLVVDGINHFAQAQRQAGYFMAVADPQSGAVVKVDAFDLNQDFDELTQMVKDPAIENYRMREFLEQIPEGYLVMVAI